MDEYVDCYVISRATYKQIVLEKFKESSRLAVERRRIPRQETMDWMCAMMHLPPPVPIKTYRWEDLRRARVRGGYPWTHLDKPPMDSDEWKEM
ncbi:hypothetical protein C0J52_21022 [Blattella germanica]|nr:hypothetical protein C0J52_21022 [Blattella germanica]